MMISSSNCQSGHWLSPVKVSLPQPCSLRALLSQAPTLLLPLSLQSDAQTAVFTGPLWRLKGSEVALSERSDPAGVRLPAVPLALHIHTLTSFSTRVCSSPKRFLITLWEGGKTTQSLLPKIKCLTFCQSWRKVLVLCGIARISGRMGI